ncbi:uncharacterized protein LOC128503227 [Spea bombifrons]|uniref:uncharacterized protein LOC128503227 n=1 Tax=Spea bombifrons TaxID=233779 RepID=UPI00234A423B|nr:uncharacterized protein LOC128503227 [Spea bombifrons]
MAVAHLPCVSLKCTSMVMDTVNFSIDYLSAFIPNAFKSSYTSTVSEGLLELKAPTKKTASSNSEDQTSQSNCKADRKRSQGVCRRSDVHLTMQYVGMGLSGTREMIKPRDEVGMFQQICGGENICVYKGYLSPGETFQFVSRRHFGFPFSASVYVNGLIAARMSSCCEYRYHEGFQQGKRGCFRIIQLRGGKPCYRCIDLLNQKHFRIKSEKDQIKSKTCEESASRKDNGTYTALEKNLETPDMDADSYPETKRQETGIKPGTLGRLPPMPKGQQVSSTKWRRRLKKKRPPKEQSDSEQENLRLKDERGRRKPKSNQPDMGDDPPRNSAVATSYSTKLMAALAKETPLCSEVELSDSSDSSGSRSVAETYDPPGDVDEAHNAMPMVDLQEAAQTQNGEESETELQIPETGSGKAEEDGNALLSQITDLISVLHECDEVDELVLRNTGMTDALLKSLVTAIETSRSQVEKINLNLNEIGPAGAETIVHLLEEKPCVKSLLLYGNQLGIDGIKLLMRGLSELHVSTRGMEKPSSDISRVRPLAISELDIGGNQIGAQGLLSVASFLRLNPPLKYLGLAQSNVNSLDAWKELFGALIVNSNLTHVLLDENSLGDGGVYALAEALRFNRSLLMVDLDSNDIGEAGGEALVRSLTTDHGSAVKHISLDDNLMSEETVDKIQTLLKHKDNHYIG